MRALLYRLRAPLIVPACRGDRAASRRLYALDRLLDVLDLPAVWRMDRQHRATMARLDMLERSLGGPLDGGD